jgi:hypothetical protein
VLGVLAVEASPKLLRKKEKLLSKSYRLSPPDAIIQDIRTVREGREKYFAAFGRTYGVFAAIKRIRIIEAKALEDSKFKHR